jgi:outer membrane biosynthesis protein TonB
MNKLICLGVLFVFISASPAKAQKTVTGRLVDKETGKPVKDAAVVVPGTDIEAVSNFLGYFQLQTDGAITIEINCSGYPLMQVVLPEGDHFKIELTKSVDGVPEETYKIKEEPPSFPGGIGNFQKYILRNIKLPEEVKRGAVSGKVWVEFVVDSLGIIPPDKIVVTEGLCKLCDEEAIRLIAASPEWNPGIVHDRPVNVSMNVPVAFNNVAEKTVKKQIKSMNGNLVEKYDVLTSDNETKHGEYKKYLRSNLIEEGEYFYGEKMMFRYYSQGKTPYLVFDHSMNKILTYEKELDLEGVYSASGEKITVDRPPVALFSDYELEWFMASNLKYPDKASESGQSGQVTILLNIDEEGSVIDNQLFLGFDDQFNKEALRVASLLPKEWKWLPAMKDGKPVNSAILFSVNFSTEWSNFK